MLENNPHIPVKVSLSRSAQPKSVRSFSCSDLRYIFVPKLCDYQGRSSAPATGYITSQYTQGQASLLGISLSLLTSNGSRNSEQIEVKHFLTLRSELFQAGVKIPRHCQDDRE